MDPLEVKLVEPLAYGLAGGVADLAGLWRLARVRPNSDRRLAHDLRAQLVPHFAPMAQYLEHDQRGKLRPTTRPLFPGYLFVAGDFAGGRRVLRVEPIADQAQVVRDLERLEQLRLAGRPLLEQAKFVPGDLVEVARGPYTGFTGRVLRQGGKTRLVVEIATLGRLLSVELDGRSLTKTPNHSPGRGVLGAAAH